MTSVLRAGNNNDSTLVDSILAGMSIREQAAQLMMIRTYSNREAGYYNITDSIISGYKPGGLCFFQGGVERQAKLTKRYQQISQIPLFIALDAEWGAAMRLDSGYRVPFQMTLGALSDDSLIRVMGRQVALELKELGVHINFAPVVDVNSNPLNPVINSRSFGSRPDLAARKGVAYMTGLQQEGVIATAKHFPGHGDTGSDSHLTLPVVNHNRSRLDSVELAPFRFMIDQGVKAIMIAHVHVPALDSTPRMPASLSKKIVTGLLRNQLGFDGLIITDALDMKGVTGYFPPGEIEVRAFEAGADILLLPQDLPRAVDALESAVRNGRIDSTDLADRCRRVLMAKAEAGLFRKAFSPDSSVLSPDSGMVVPQRPMPEELLNRLIYRKAVTLLTDPDSLVPLTRTDTLKVALVAAGSAELTPFQQTIKRYLSADEFVLHDGLSEARLSGINKELDDYNLVIVSVHGTNIFPSKNFGIDRRVARWVRKISSDHSSLLVLFGSPYALPLFGTPEDYRAVVIGYEDNAAAMSETAQAIMGAHTITGSLPVDVPGWAEAGRGILRNSLSRLSYTIPQEQGIEPEWLAPIDSIIRENIAQKAMPGCQVLMAVDGKVIYNKSFGYHTYRRGRFVRPDDLYDLASVTKVAATTLSLMKLYDEGLFDIDQPLSTYLPFLRSTNKAGLIIRDVLTHQAQLQPWIPFYINTLRDGKPDPGIYAASPGPEKNIQVTESLFIDRNYHWFIYDTIARSPLLEEKKYKYSDLGFYLMSRIIENLTNRPLNLYAEENFYRPMGMSHTLFNPLTRYDKVRIVPTEIDNYFRQQEVWGTVHDPGAAMLGGVSGHAGLFSNATDLAALMQMLLQKGYYGGRQYLKPETVELFTRQQFPLNDNRRGLGFDKPEPEERDTGPACELSSLNSFGHSGFTGTLVWADPDYRMVYVFLSNRTWPDASNNLLITNNVRTEIQKVMYRALIRAGGSDKESDLSFIPVAE
ncbi:MAG: glycoside hydrolase family 3 N-terminal domain-containing protein [Bacteroidales bacterium]